MNDIAALFALYIDIHLYFIKITMTPIVIYDSLYGNTRKVAEAIALGLGNIKYALNIKDVSLRNLYQAELLVIGSPVHKRSPSIKTLQLLQSLGKRTLRSEVSAFDTKYDRFFAGNATGKIVSKLKRAGGHVLSGPRHFIVSGKEGPLLEDQLERAIEWGKQLKQLWYWEKVEKHTSMQLQF